MELQPNASTAAIKKRYYELAKRLHPDAPGGDLEKFRELSKAYEFLSDPVKRNTFGTVGWDVPQSADPWNPSHNPSNQSYRQWAPEEDFFYQNPPFVTPRFTSNANFFAILSGATALGTILCVWYFTSTRSKLMLEADRHHAQASRDLERARTGAQRFGNQHAVNRMLEQRIKGTGQSNKHDD
ncbi:DnaJ domain-containing protein [Phycomyces nitens]|nr:DnaJ domain-containing protein [Phycomyces nitens]